MFYDIQEARLMLESRLNGFKAEIGIILGTGLSGLTTEIQDPIEVPYIDIPNFPQSTVTSHEGKLIAGYINGTAVYVLSGRLHYYEGYDLKQVTFPTRVLHALGAKKLIISNASGGLNPDYEEGELVLVKDHINLMPENPLRGINDSRLGPRFPDLLDAYSKHLRYQAQEKAETVLGKKLHEGVYVCLQGPSLETPAEYQYMHNIGGHVVGMSTVPEVIVARQIEMEVLCFSIVTNVCIPIERLTKTTVEEVVEVANKAEKKLTRLVSALLADL